MDLDGGEIHNEGRLKGPPLQTAREMDFPPSKFIGPAPYKKQVYIGNFMDKRQEISGPMQRWFLIRGCGV
jgi:hypothetical protein